MAIYATTPMNAEIHNFQTDKICYEIVNVEPRSIMLGDSYVNEMTRTSGSLDHERWKANTILLDLGNAK